MSDLFDTKAYYERLNAIEKAEREQNATLNLSKLPELSKLPINKPYFRLPSPEFHLARILRPFSLPALCAAYKLPRNLKGGNKIAVIELGGSWTPRDMQIFCLSVGMPVPNVINPVSPFPSDPSGADYEVALDMQVAAFVNWWCTGKVPTINMIWDKTGTIYGGVIQAAATKSDTCSISWGAPENEWGPQQAAKMSSTAWNAVGSGMAIFAATGDNDYTDGEPGGAHVDLPGSAPGIVGCSGTTKTSSIETCWNNGPNSGTGGGYSIYWPRPTWQTIVPKMSWSRSVGDVSANADPNTGYEIVVGGNVVVVGGTSAAAPLWAALIAAIKSRPGFIGQKLYQNYIALTRITAGDNGKFPASVCNGLGVPNGATIGGVLV